MLLFLFVLSGISINQNLPVIKSIASITYVKMEKVSKYITKDA